MNNNEQHGHLSSARMVDVNIWVLNYNYVKIQATYLFVYLNLMSYHFMLLTVFIFNMNLFQSVYWLALFWWQIG